MSEKDISGEEVREEHLRKVKQPLHWSYMLSVMIGSLALMLIFMAVLGGGSS